MNLVDKVNAKSVKTDIPDFRVGDTVRVDYKIVEGNTHRIQAFEGLVVAIKGGSIGKTFTVRKKSGSVAVKRVFKVNSPLVDKIVVIRKGMVKRAKLNFVDKMSKDYNVKERN
ncbi:MAG TPA: 50S ribosomal protein L19 [Bacilli bacterium]|nr:50S ribosomal protein L19 [Bacilli bacterium]HQC83792.1 50S ribosomal protein L19 [Bacilli bacterium]